MARLLTKVGAMPEYREVLDNPHSDRIRHVAELNDRRRRLKYGRFLVEGPQCVREAVLCKPECLLDIYLEVDAKEQKVLSPVVEQIRLLALEHARDVYIHYVSSRVMRSISLDAQGIVAVGKIQNMENTLDELGDVCDGATMNSQLKSVVALWQVRDPGNEGTVIRTADAAGLQAVLLVDNCVDYLNPKVLRATAGSIFHIPVVRLTTEDFFNWCTSIQMSVIAADIYGSKDKPPVSLPDYLDQNEQGADKRAILFGNEARGLPAEVVENADTILSIPIYGKAESLNLATSVAVILYSLSMSSRFGRM